VHRISHFYKRARLPQVQKTVSLRRKIYDPEHPVIIARPPPSSRVWNDDFLVCLVFVPNSSLHLNKEFSFYDNQQNAFFLENCS
jgi:hypothetical protein